MNLNSIKPFNMPEILDERGNLRVFENNQYFPFETEWVSWACIDKDSGQQSNLNYNLSNLVLVVLTGTMEITISNGKLERNIVLDSDDNCIFLPLTIWWRIKHVEKHSIFFVLSDGVWEGDGKQIMSLIETRSHYEADCRP